jgi:FkbM family methyltransferase
MSGGELVITAPDAMEFRALQGFYREEWGELHFLRAVERKLRGGGVCYDVGGYLGQFLIPVAKIVGERGLVVGFEPLPANHERLMRTVASYQLTNVKVFRLALSDYNGEAPILGADSGATIVPRAAGLKQSSPNIAVQVTRGDDLGMAAGLPVPKAIKIDVEGAEFGVLSGLEKTLSSPLCELLCLEIHPRFLPAPVSLERVLSLVRSLGFNQVQTRPRGAEIHLIAEKVQAQA